MYKPRLFNKTSFLLVISLLLLVGQGFVAMQVTYLLIAVLFTDVSYLLPIGSNWTFQAILFLLCTFLPNLVLLLSAMTRVIASEESHLDYLSLLSFLLISTIGDHPPIKVAFTAILLFFSFYLRKEDQRTTDFEKKYIVSKNTRWEKRQELSEQNKVLTLSQGTQSALQIAEERNRIVRDIHDNVSHLLSNAILQIGALEMINQEPRLEEPLENLSTTVHAGMDRIRQSVRDLHETSISFQHSLESLAADFLSSVMIEGSLFEGSSETQQNCFSMAIEEALTNSIKHSHARTVVLHFRVLPTFYRL